MQLEPAIVAPGAAIEADHQRALTQQRGKIDQPALAIGHYEIGELVADGRNESIGAVGLNARDELVVGGLEIGEKLARFPEIELQPLIERSLDGIRLAKGFGQSLFE